MRKVLACVMIAVLVGFASISSAPTLAQDKTKTKVKESKKAGTIEIAAGKDEKYRFVIRDSEGKYLAMSGTFATEMDAKDGIETLKDVLKNAKVTTKKSDK